MRLPKKNLVEFSEKMLKATPLREFVSPGMAIRKGTWNGFGANAGVLGFEDIEEKPIGNIENEGFVESFLSDDEDVDVNEEAE